MSLLERPARCLQNNPRMINSLQPQIDVRISFFCFPKCDKDVSGVCVAMCPDLLFALMFLLVLTGAL